MQSEKYSQQLGIKDILMVHKELQCIKSTNSLFYKFSIHTHAHIRGKDKYVGQQATI